MAEITAEKVEYGLVLMPSDGDSIIHAFCIQGMKQILFNLIILIFYSS
jgi:hypothetical protein